MKNRVYYEYYHLDGTQEVPADYKEISFVCLRPDGSLELPSTLGIACRSVSKSWKDLKIFTFTSYDIPTPATCSRMELLRKMYRNC